LGVGIRRSQLRQEGRQLGLAQHRQAQPALNAAAIACAEKIRVAANKQAGGERGGDPGTRGARWVAADALRELTSERAQARLKD